ncbi:MAG: hypothetical protein PUE12_11655 [Oscillospiraceae bacterium]|nr:hypothetical protein [Oscillospiraceae bacterium]
MNIKKKFLSLILCTLFFNSLPLVVYASENYEILDSVVERLENGDYITITIVDNYGNQRSSGSKSKIYDYYSSNNVKLWRYTLNGEFSYDGSSSSCTGVSDSFFSYDNNYRLINKNCYKSGNTAYGSFSVEQKFMGIKINTFNDSISISCSPNGNYT